MAMFSSIIAAAREAGAAAELAASRKEEKYRDIDGRYIFEPIAVETLGIHNESARQLLTDLGRRISESSGDARETSFLFQRISVLVQRFNAVLLHDSLPVHDFTDWWSYPLCICLIFKLPREHIYRGLKN